MQHSIPVTTPFFVETNKVQSRTLQKIYFLAFVLLALCTSQSLSAKTQKALCTENTSTTSHFNGKIQANNPIKHGIVHQTRPNATAPKARTKSSATTVLTATRPFLGYTPLSTVEQLQESAINYILIGSIVVIQIFTTIIYLLHLKSAAKRRQLAIRNQEALKFQIALAERHIQKKKAKQKELEQQLELVNKQLTSYTFNYQQKNKIIDQLQEIVEKLENTTSSTEKSSLLNEVKKLTKENLIIDKNWEHFRNFFEEAQFGFNAKLLSKHPKLKANDLKLCSLIRLNLNIKETAEILGISPGSVKTSRHRLRKKLNLNPKDDIIDYLASLETEDFIVPPA